MEKYGDAKLPELRHVLANCPKARSLSIHDRCEHARHLERMICVDLAPNSAPSASATWIFSTCPRPGFRTEGAGEAREPGPIRQSPRVASKLARPQRLFNHLRILTETSR